MSRYYSLKTIRDNAKDVTLENGVKHRCIDPDALFDIEPADVRENITAHKVIGGGEHDGATCWFECSRCGKTVDVNDKYCSECGARFEE